MANLFVDASLFLGMHAQDETLRIKSKNFFVRQLDAQPGMSLEQVGLCDDVIWRHPRAEQDAYYPFMDCLHTHMQMPRPAVTEADVATALEHPELKSFAMPERLLLGKVCAERAQLVTLRPLLLQAAGRLPVSTPEDGAELSFPADLEALYQVSLALRLTAAELKL